MRAAPAFVIVALACLGASDSAIAGTFCVGPSPCDPSLQSALDDAEALSGEDTVTIAPGTYTGTFSYNDADKVNIVGAGVGQTILRNPAGSDTFDLTTLTASPAARSVISDLTLEAASAVDTSDVTIRLAQSRAERVSVTTPDNGQAVFLREGGSISASTVRAIGATARGVESADPDTEIESTLITGQTGVILGTPDAEVDISRSTIEASNSGVLVLNGDADIVNSVVRMSGNGYAISSLSAGAGATPNVLVLHGTLIGNGAGGGLRVSNQSGSTSVVLTARSSSISGFASSGQAQSTTADPASLTVTDSNYLGSLTGTGDGASVTAADNSSLDPRYVGAPGDLRPRFDSPLVDTGDTTNLLLYGPVDIRGLPRLVNGRRDMGAYEYQRATPTVTAKAELVGGAPRFTASGADIDGDALTYSWDFNTGTPATGPVVTPLIARPAIFPQPPVTVTGTVTATDPTGKTATATASVTLPGDPPLAAAPPDRTKPKISRVSYKKGVLRFTLSETAKVKVTATRKGRKKPSKTASINGKKGVNKKKLKLKRGRYTLKLVATDAAKNKSKTARKRIRR